MVVSGAVAGDDELRVIRQRRCQVVQGTHDFFRGAAGEIGASMEPAKSVSPAMSL